MSTDVNMASTSSSVSTSDYGGSKQHCYVPMCNSNSRYDPSLSFHHFPKDNSLKKQWITKIRRDEGPHFKVRSYICYLCFSVNKNHNKNNNKKKR